MTKTVFEVRITLANDAMQTPNDVGWALHAASDQLIGLQAWYDTERPIRDNNGNTVGYWKVDAYTTNS